MPAYHTIRTSRRGADLGTLLGAQHCDQVWQTPTFGRFQTVSDLFWQWRLNDDVRAADALMEVLDEGEWTTLLDNFPPSDLRAANISAE